MLRDAAAERDVTQTLLALLRAAAADHSSSSSLSFADPQFIASLEYLANDPHFRFPAAILAEVATSPTQSELIVRLAELGVRRRTPPPLGARPLAHREREGRWDRADVAAAATPRITLVEGDGQFTHRGTERSFALEHVRALSRWRVVPDILPSLCPRRRMHIALQLEDDGGDMAASTASAAICWGRGGREPPFLFAPYEGVEPSRMPLLLDGKRLEPRELAECARRVVEGVPFASCSYLLCNSVVERYSFCTAPLQAYVVRAREAHKRELERVVGRLTPIRTEWAEHGSEIGAVRRRRRRALEEEEEDDS